MKITILCAGKFKEAYWEAAAAEYQKRLTRYCSLQVIAVADEATPEHASEKQEQRIRERKGSGCWPGWIKMSRGRAAG